VEFISPIKLIEKYDRVIAKNVVDDLAEIGFTSNKVSLDCGCTIRCFAINTYLIQDVYNIHNTLDSRNQQQEPAMSRG
jgi:hypothetical protein